MSTANDLGSFIEVKKDPINQYVQQENGRSLQQVNSNDIQPVPQQQEVSNNLQNVTVVQDVVQTTEIADSQLQELEAVQLEQGRVNIIRYRVPTLFFF